MKKLILFAALVLAGCGGAVKPPVPTPPPLPTAFFASAKDLAGYLFDSQLNNIGNTFVTDIIAADGMITRITYTPGLTYQLTSPYHGAEIDTRSIYRIASAKNCIQAIAEETREHSTGKVIAIQNYPNTPCWLSSDTLTGRIDNELYIWNEFDLDGTVLYPSSGTFDDRTKLTFAGEGAVLVEFYEDTTLAKEMTTPYCGVGSYSLRGMLSIRQDPTACK